MDKFTKIDENFYYDIIEREDDIHKYLVNKIDMYLTGCKADATMILEESVINCESPIEQLLSLSLENLNIKNLCIYNPFIDVLDIEKQYEINCNGRRYRVDFFIPVIYKNQGIKWFVIECDGHEFHQKTKEQVERDNERMRDLQKAGCDVIRFSGTEIWHKPYRCATEVLNIILSKCKYVKEENDV